MRCFEPFFRFENDAYTTNTLSLSPMSFRNIICVFLLFSLGSLSAEYRILCFGDSNTWGWKPNSEKQRFLDEERWAGVLQSELGARYTVICDGLVARRTDIDGLTVGMVDGTFLNGAKTLPVSIIRNAPVDLVIIFLGTNDLQRGPERSAEEIANAVAGLASLVGESSDLLYSSYPAPTDVWIVVPPALRDLSSSPLKGLFEVGIEESKQLASPFKDGGEKESLRLVF
ncbi:MAG: GDSL-type esterase/lipase family protein, partial [Verrucomicrobiota bacterium]